MATARQYCYERNPIICTGKSCPGYRDKTHRKIHRLCIQVRYSETIDRCWLLSIQPCLLCIITDEPIKEERKERGGETSQLQVISKHTGYTPESLRTRAIAERKPFPSTGPTDRIRSKDFFTSNRLGINILNLSTHTLTNIHMHSPTHSPKHTHIPGPGLLVCAKGHVRVSSKLAEGRRPHS